MRNKLSRMLVLPFVTRGYGDGAVDQGSGLAIAGPYATAGQGRGGPGFFDRTGEYLTLGHTYRLRQDGDVIRVRLYVADTRGLDGLRIRVWREEGGSYRLVGSSEDIAPRLEAGRVNTMDLESPIRGVQEGDYYGYAVESSAGRGHLHASRTAGLSTTCFTDSAVEDGTRFDARSARCRRRAVVIEMYMRPPDLVFTGDSIIAGSVLHRSYLDTRPGPLSRPSASIPSMLSGMLGLTYQNMAHGGQTTSQIADRFETDVVALHPGVVVMNGGANDIDQGVSAEVFLDNWRRMLDRTARLGIPVAVLLMTPWTRATDSRLEQLEHLNASLARLADDHPLATVVDCGRELGRPRASGPPSNLWDIKPEYDADGGHLTESGYQVVSRKMCDVIKNSGILP